MKDYIEILDHTPVEVVDKGVSVCWGVFKDEPDEARMIRVINKYRHRSIVEHCRLTIKMNQIDNDVSKLIEYFRNDNFSYVKPYKNTFLVNTNLRVILEADRLDNNVKRLLTPEPYHFLLEGE